MLLNRELSAEGKLYFAYRLNFYLFIYLVCAFGIALVFFLFRGMFVLKAINVEADVVQ